MKQVRHKLHSERGASILAALLFFLLCSMVGATVLMAAASNAGKIRGSQEEQQKYFTLSSALRLVCDKLTAGDYTAKYQMTVTEHWKTVTTTAEDGTVDTDMVHDYFLQEYVQLPGAYSGELSEGEAENVLPLLRELDWLYAGNFERPAQLEGDPRRTYETLPPLDLAEPVPHTLVLTVEPDDGTGLCEPVEVVVKLGAAETDQYRLYLSAVLCSDRNYAMYGELISASPPKLELSGMTAEGIYEFICSPVTWELSQITREVGGDGP